MSMKGGCNEDIARLFPALPAARAMDNWQWAKTMQKRFCLNIRKWYCVDDWITGGGSTIDGQLSSTTLLGQSSSPHKDTGRKYGEKRKSPELRLGAIHLQEREKTNKQKTTTQQRSQRSKVGKQLFSTSYKQAIFSHNLERRGSRCVLVAKKDKHFNNRCPFGQVRSVVLVMFPPQILSSFSLLTFVEMDGGVGEAVDVSALLSNSQKISAISLLFQKQVQSTAFYRLLWGS